LLTCSRDIDQVWFDLSPVIKDQNEIIKTTDVIRKNFKMFQINFIEKMIGEVGYESYPCMNYTTAIGYNQSKR
jgi:hypothetical protein